MLVQGYDRIDQFGFVESRPSVEADIFFTDEWNDRKRLWDAYVTMRQNANLPPLPPETEVIMAGRELPSVVLPLLGLPVDLASYPLAAYLQLTNDPREYPAWPMHRVGNFDIGTRWQTTAPVGAEFTTPEGWRLKILLLNAGEGGQDDGLTKAFADRREEGQGPFVKLAFRVAPRA